MTLALALALLAAWGVGAAHAAPRDLEVTITPLQPPPRGLRIRPDPALPVPVAVSGPVAVDGVFDEPAWRDAAPGPPLSPFADGTAPPAVGLRALRVPEGLAVAIDGVEAIPRGHAHVLLDPDGTGARWVVVTVGAGAGGEVRVEACTLAAFHEPQAAPIGAHSVPCEPTEEAAAIAGPDGVEVRFAGQVGAALTRSGRLAFMVTGAKGVGGTWAAFGARMFRADQGRSLQLPGAPAPPRRGGPYLRASARVDGGLDVEARVPAEVAAAGAVAWRRLAHGRVIDAGSWPVVAAGEGGEVRATLPPTALLPHATRAVTLELRWPDTPVPTTLLARGAAAPAAAWVRTPLHRGVVAVAWQSQAAVDGATLEVWRPASGAREARVLGRAALDLPAGDARLDVVVPWRGAVDVTLHLPLGDDDAGGALQLGPWPTERR